MFALECASLLTCKLDLLHRPIGATDLQDLAEALQKSNRRCPKTARKAIPKAVRSLMQEAEARRPDQLLGLWVIAGEQVRQRGTPPQNLWVAQFSRRSLPRPVVKALLGLDRDTILDLIGCEDVLEEERRQRDIGFCDNHLHSGAADELGDLLERLIPRTVEDTKPRKLASATGTGGLNAGPVMLALTASCALLGSAGEPATRKEKSLADASWWKFATRLAKEGEDLEEGDFTVLREAVQGVVKEQGAPPRLSALYDELTRVAQGAPVAPGRLEAARRGLIALSVLHCLIAVPPGSSLGTFVPRFGLMRTVRGLFGADEERLESALRTMYIYSGVTGVELRKSIVPLSGRTISVERIVSAIRLDMKEHAKAAVAACEGVRNDELVVRMPLTFTRRESKPVEPGIEPVDFLPFRDPVGETLAVADAIVQATAETSLARFVGGVDVVGDEKTVPNWLYALAYKRIASAASLEFASHAGEYFADRLEGLRRVGEIALFQPANITRIGHCLAVGVEEGTDGENDDAGVLLENTIWATLLLEGCAGLGLGWKVDRAKTKKLELDLNRLMLQIAPYVFGANGLTAKQLCDWYLARFNPAVIGRWLPLLQETRPEETEDWPRGMSRSLLPKAITPEDAMMFSTLYETAVDVPAAGGGARRVQFAPEAKLPSQLADSSRQLLSEVKPYALAAIEGWLLSKRIVIESCPSSNAALIDIDIDRHPIWDFHRKQLTCSVNTDDPALFGAALREEYVHAGMVADREGDDGGAFVRALAESSRTAGTLQRSLCEGKQKPVDAYRAVLASIGP